MKDVYKSPYEAYPFLRDKSSSLLCDFELMTDRMASLTGLLRAEVLTLTCQDETLLPMFQQLDQELLWLTEMIYHLNASLRTKYTLRKDELARLLDLTNAMHELTKEEGMAFYLPSGSTSAMQAHLLRVDAKSLVRLLYRHIEQGHVVEEEMLDFSNLLSGFFFMCALFLNRVEGVSNVPFVSRNYKV